MSFDLLSESYPKARKEHICEWCGEKILKNETYYRYTGLHDGDFQSTPLHLECKKAMQKDLLENGQEEYEPFAFKRGSMESK